MSSLSKIGLALSIIGAVLDFASGTLILQTASMPVEGGMGMTPITTSAYLWVFVLTLLGALLITTGILGVTHVGMGRTRLFGGAMMVYGATMLIIGGLMFTGFTLMMQGAEIFGIAMPVVGLAMVVTGLIMGARQPMSESRM